jgi:glycosyltransferase involved in cell wall biosynthesis
VVLFLGRMIEEKGPHVLLQAATQIKDQLGPFKIRFVGSAGFAEKSKLTPYEQRLRHLAHELGDRVEFVPARDRNGVREELSRASIFCMPSTWDEPAGLAVLEGMASGLPTIASRRGGIPEEVGDGALLFEPDSPCELAQHLKSLLQHDDKRQVWGQRARRRAEELAWENQYERLCETLR